MGRKPFSQTMAQEVRDEYFSCKRSLAKVAKMFRISETTANNMICQIGPYKKEKKTTKLTICLDFDGVVHSYISGWHGPTLIPDPPVPYVRLAINQLRENYEVKIHSTRCGHEGGMEAIVKWLMQYDIMVDEICEHKPPAVVYVDDRGLQFNGDWSQTIEDISNFKHWIDQSVPSFLRKDSDGKKGSMVHPDISDSNQVRELKRMVEQEKETRIKYQDVVYKVCVIVDRRKGKGSIVTVDQVVDEIECLIKR